MVKKTYKASPEQIQNAKDKLEQTLNESEHIITDLINNYETSEEDLINLFKFASRFYKYSLRNTALIRKQNPSAVFCASFNDWKKKDAHILRGSKGATILVPKKIKYIYDEENDEYVKWSNADDDLLALAKSGKTEVKEKTVYGNGTVFDIGQTDFPKEKYPTLFSVGVTSTEHYQLFNMLNDYCVSLNCNVEVHDLNSIALNGFYAPKDNKIVINSILNDTNRLSTLSHEFGHLIAEHSPMASDKSAAQREVEADIISILLTSYFNLDIELKRKEHLKGNIDILTKEFSRQYDREKDNLTHDNKDYYINSKIENIINNTFEIYKKHATNLDELYQQKIEQLNIENEEIQEETHEI